MPTIDISFSDLEKLVGKALPKDERLGELLSNVKGEVENFEGDIISINLQDGNRPDLWCAEGIARELKAVMGLEKGVKQYSSHPSDYRILVNGRLDKIRAFIACAVVKGVKLSDQVLKQIMQQQEKIDATYGRNRKRTSIGLYKVDKLAWPLKYFLTKPHDNSFTPLGFTEKMTPHEVLKKHPKGQEYGLLLKDLPEYPIFLDNNSKVLSMPPIINSSDIGQVDEKTENILVEVTGTDYVAVNNVLRIIAMTLADRGGKIHQVQIDYPYRGMDTTPHLETKKIAIGVPKVNEWLGTKLDGQDVAKLLQKMRYSVSPISESQLIPQSMEVEIPSYRTDIMHVVDIYEDIAIAYGFNKFEPEIPAMPTAGKIADIEKLSNKIRELCIGLGAQEVINFNLTNKETLFYKMNTNEENIIEISNPVSLTYSILRSKLLPSVLEFLSKNTTKEYPQRVFEVGDVTFVNSKSEVGCTTEKRLCLAISNTESATFTEAKQALQSIFANLGKTIAVKEADHDSFIIGRCASIHSGKDRIGIIGELHPKVLQNWGIEMPVVAFELKL